MAIQFLRRYLVCKPAVHANIRKERHEEGKADRWKRVAEYIIGSPLDQDN